MLTVFLSAFFQYSQTITTFVLNKTIQTMPIIKIHAINPLHIIEISKELQSSLAKTFETSADNITIEIITSSYISNGEIEQNPTPMVEILAFEREKHIEQSAAKIISGLLTRIGYSECDTYYIHLTKSNYYVNGEPLD